MKVICDYIEHKLDLSCDNVLSLEIENKTYFYRFIKDLYKLSDGEMLEEFEIFTEDNKNISFNKFRIINDYFRIDYLDKKYEKDFIKYIASNMSEELKKKLYDEYIEMEKKIIKDLYKNDLKLEVTYEYTLESFFKLFKFNVELHNNLLDNLFLIIDVEKALNTNNILVFINLKSYINKAELQELYKYAVQNNQCLLLIDSNSNGIRLEYENKIIIDSNLDEFMLQ